MEHFVTLFDSGYLPQALALYHSLTEQGEEFSLWAICMDAKSQDALMRLGYRNFLPIPLEEVEKYHSHLLDVKSTRTHGEYCWTLTPFSYEAVMRRVPSVDRVTYLDADVCFFGKASLILRQMDEYDCSALLTEHAYAPEYLREETNGKFCVQFLPISSSKIGIEIIKWWQERCVEWCYSRCEDGKFGDQKYLEAWEDLWPGSVCVLKDIELTLAPWNVDNLAISNKRRCIYHYHGFRLYRRLIRKWSGYKVNPRWDREFYDPYVDRIGCSIAELKLVGIECAGGRIISNVRDLAKMLGRIVIKGNESWVRRS